MSNHLLKWKLEILFLVWKCQHQIYKKKLFKILKNKLKKQPNKQLQQLKLPMYLAKN